MILIDQQDREVQHVPVLREEIHLLSQHREEVLPEVVDRSIDLLQEVDRVALLVGHPQVVDQADFRDLAEVLDPDQEDKFNTKLIYI